MHPRELSKNLHYFAMLGFVDAVRKDCLADVSLACEEEVIDYSDQFNRYSCDLIVYFNEETSLHEVDDLRLGLWISH